MVTSEDDQLVPAEVGVADREDLSLREDVVADRDRRRALPAQADVLEDEGDADSGDQRRESRRPSKRPVGDGLDRYVQQAGESRCDQEHRNDPDEHAPGLGETEPRDHRDRQHRAEHEDVAVGEVDQLEDAVDQRVPERDQRVDHAERQPDQEEVDPVRGGLDEVDEEPDADQRDEKEPEDLDRLRPVAASQCGECSSAVWVATGSGKLKRLTQRLRAGSEKRAGTTIWRRAAVSELVDEAASKAAAPRGVWVRFPPAACITADRLEPVPE